MPLISQEAVKLSKGEKAPFVGALVSFDRLEELVKAEQELINVKAISEEKSSLISIKDGKEDAYKELDEVMQKQVSYLKKENAYHLGRIKIMERNSKIHFVFTITGWGAAFVFGGILAGVSYANSNN